ncbi:TRAP transporter substrate-binding protein [Acuticoccus sp.]|uniref:TRAP transporter substrate-binding protein n=1 Tax=Acuticoccus sp. TaxID=1904378 RepID=UPI003B520181
MNARSVLTLALSTTLAASLCTLLPDAATARTLKLQTSSNASHFSLQYLREKWLPKLTTMTEGELEIEFLPIESVVGHRETPEAIQVGILDGDYTATAYFAGTDPAFALMGDLIAGYDSPEQVWNFCQREGGREVLQKLYDEYFPGVHVVACGAYSREAFVSTVPIEKVSDLEGKKIRSPEGLAADVFRRAGAAPVALPASETYGALERRVIDAADNSAYVNNDANGMHKIAKYPIYPGIHSMPTLQLTFNQEVWDSLTDAQRTIIEVWWEAAYMDLTREVRQQDLTLVSRDRADSDLTIIDWPQAERDKFREIATEAWKDFAAGSELAQEAYDTHIAYMKKAGLLSADFGSQ